MAEGDQGRDLGHHRLVERQVGDSAQAKTRQAVITREEDLMAQRWSADAVSLIRRLAVAELPAFNSSIKGAISVAVVPSKLPITLSFKAVPSSIR